MARPSLEDQFPDLVVEIQKKFAGIRTARAVIEELYSLHPTWTASQIHKAMPKVSNNSGGTVPSASYVQHQLSDIRNGLEEKGVEAFVFEDWQPWSARSDAHLPPDALEEVFASQHWSILTLGRRLYQHEADWVGRLHRVLKDKRLFVLYRFLLYRLYSQREAMGRNLGAPPNTGGLDDFVMCEPWASRSSWRSYERLISHGKVHPMEIGVEFVENAMVGLMPGADSFVGMCVGILSEAELISALDQFRQFDLLGFSPSASLIEQSHERLLRLTQSNSPESTVLTDEQVENLASALFFWEEKGET